MTDRVKKILSVFGTRPEAIKMAPLVRHMGLNKNFDICVIQHREMLDQMKSNQIIFRNDLWAKLQELGKISVFTDFNPDLVLVHGDTATTFAAALAAYHSKVKVGHVEAGLRTGNLYSPWPEEANRKLTGAICNYHFAPTLLAKQNLVAEGVDEKNIYVTGNTVVDALFLGLQLIENDNGFVEKIYKKLSFLSLENKIVLITGHRRENFGLGFQNICEAIAEIATTKPEVNFLSLTKQWY